MQDRQVDPLTPGIKNMSGIYKYISQTCPQLTDHGTESCHWIKFQEAVILAKISNFMDQIVKGVTELKLHANNINRDEGLTLSKAENPTIRLLRHSNTYFFPPLALQPQFGPSPTSMKLSVSLQFTTS
jgi:hypothetical protein